MLTCPNCNRTFSEKAGKRHMPHCAEKHRKKDWHSGKSQNYNKKPRKRYVKKRR